MNRLYVVEPTAVHHGRQCGSSPYHYVPVMSDCSLALWPPKLWIWAVPPKCLPQCNTGWRPFTESCKRIAPLRWLFPGEYQPTEIHALAHAINAAWETLGNTVYYTDPVEATPVNPIGIAA